MNNSDVGLAIRKSLYHSLSGQTRNFLIELFEEFKEETSDWYLFIADDVQWNAYSNNKIKTFKRELDELMESKEDDDGEDIDPEYDSSDITLIVSTYGFPNDEDDDMNDGRDPWNLKRETRTVLSYAS